MTMTLAMAAQQQPQSSTKKKETSNAAQAAPSKAANQAFHQTSPAKLQKGTSAIPAAPNGSAQLSTDDQLFLKALIEEDISEIELAGLALQKTSNADVKQYAQTKILAADPEMRVGAAQLMLKYGQKPPDDSGFQRKKIKDELTKKSGQDFDNAYMSYETDQQNADLKLVNTELGSTKNPEVKSYVAKEQAPVQQAADAALQVHQKVIASMKNYRQPAVGKNGQ